MEENTRQNVIDFYPVGSVVIAKGNVKKMVIIARGIIAELEGALCFFDYAAVCYPEGLLNDRIMYFNHKDIYKLVHEGYSDEDETMMKETVNDWIRQTDIPRGDAHRINMSRVMKTKKDTEG